MKSTVKAARISGNDGDRVVLYEDPHSPNRTFALTVEEARTLSARLLVLVDRSEAAEVLALAGHVVKFGAALEKELNG